MTDVHVVLLQTLVAEVRGLRADLAARREAGPLQQADYLSLVPLVPAIGAAIGSAEFTCRELIDGHPELEEVLDGHNPKSLGKLFKRAEGVPIGGYVLRVFGSERGVVLWSVEHLL